MVTFWHCESSQTFRGSLPRNLVQLYNKSTERTCVYWTSFFPNNIHETGQTEPRKQRWSCVKARITKVVVTILEFHFRLSKGWKQNVSTVVWIMKLFVFHSEWFSKKWLYPTQLGTVKINQKILTCSFIFYSKRFLRLGPAKFLKSCYSLYIVLIWITWPHLWLRNITDIKGTC